MVTQQDLADTVAGLRQEAQTLRSAASTQPVPDMDEAVVLVKVAGLIRAATYLDQVAAELLTLIDSETPVEVPRKEPK